ncbi:Predicted arabinose efflux permease, MFS family [Ruegeria halocynthiae]|uniref:Predicted arabinose efflux permease, MFS family n=1 Tax=Ruegeria halocynthiae TaxID=985054 RepID=A0A1H2YBK3_9RHOB|nr:MFS transporter [Ruegeria halocynthiae]SDX02536.1 Predicted arabinose efflux permease, MFS family [Ruegeria halocynthiae]
MDRNSIIKIIALMVTAFGIGIDFTGALMLVPAIENSFDTDITSTQWVLNIYALFFAMTMVAGGRLGDMYGHRKMMIIGLSIFLFASVLCFASPGLDYLIGARALQGIGAGCVWPCTLAFGATKVSKEEHRAMIMGLILAGVTTGNVFGPMISGAAVDLGDWRLFFLANVIFSCISMATAILLMERETEHKKGEHIDFAGIGILSFAVLLLLYGLDVGADWGWVSLPLLLLLSVSAVLFFLFPKVERRVREPLLLPQLMQNREFLITLGLNMFNVSAAFVGLLYFPQYMQKVLGWSVFQSALGLAPLTVLLAVGSIVSGTLYNDFGPKRLLLWGYLCATVGAASVVLMPTGTGYLQILPGMALIGLGATLTVGPSGTAAVCAVTPERAGLVGGLSFMTHLVYGAISVACATAIMYASSLSSLKTRLATAGIDMSEADQKAINSGTLTTESSKAVLQKLNAGEAEKVRTAIAAAFDTGMNMAFVFATFSVAAGIILALMLDEKKLHKVEG